MGYITYKIIVATYRSHFGKRRNLNIFDPIILPKRVNGFNKQFIILNIMKSRTLKILIFKRSHAFDY